MPLPNTTFRSELPHVVRKELDQSNADTAGYLVTEHDEDGHHTHITAKSLKVKGPVAITGGPLTVNGAPVVPGGGGTAPAPHHVTHEPGGADALTQLDAGIITTGTLADARLSPNVALRNAFNIFTQGQEVAVATPVINLRDTSAPVNARRFRVLNENQFLYLQATDDAIAASHGYARVSRNGALYSTDVITANGAFYERGRPQAVGDWQDVPYSAANFTASGGASFNVTAGQLALNRYTLIGKTMIWSLFINGASISGATPAELYVKAPGGFTFKPYATLPTGRLHTGGSEFAGTIYTNAAGVTIQANPYQFLPTGTVYIQASIIAEIN